MNNKMLETPSGQISYGDQHCEAITANEASLQIPFGQMDFTENEQIDSVVSSVMQKYIQRSLVGKKKYGTTLDRDDLTIVEWINHTQEELMDATLYLEKLKKTLVEKGLGPATTDT